MKIEELMRGQSHSFLDIRDTNNHVVQGRLLGG